MADSDRISTLREIIRSGDRNTAAGFARQCLQSGMSPSEVMGKVIYPLMREMSDAFVRLDVFLPELMKKNVSVTQCYGKNCI